MKLNNGKASGADSIKAEMLKSGCSHILKVITKLFNTIFTSSCFPDKWRESCITAIHKKGDYHDTGNYRGIAVGSILCKVFNSVLHSRLADYIEREKIIPVNQIGYKKKNRTSDHIFTLKTIIDKYISRQNRQYLYVCFVDLKSAFDTVWREAMMYKLLKNGVSGLFLSILQDMYKEVRFRVKTANGLTDSFESSVGVKQGCVLSPTLFNIFLYDFPSIFTPECKPVELYNDYLNCILFADDMVIMSETAEGLQKCLDCVSQFCDKWRLQVNTSKTKIIIFNKGGHKISKFKFHYNEHEIEIVQNYVYLGITLNACGSFKQAIYNLADKAKKAYYSLIKKLPDCSVKLALKMFRIIVQPVLSYCCEIWSPVGLNVLNANNFIELCDKPDGEKIHLKFLKFILGVQSKSSNHASRGELGEFPILISQTILSIKYLIRLTTMPEESLAYKSLLQCKHSTGVGSSTWLNGLKNIFTYCNEMQNWNKIMNGEYVNKRMLYTSVEKNMKSIYESQWHDKINRASNNGIEGNKLRTYCTFKEKFEMENYLLFGSSKTERSSLSKLRISAHRLRIETGRHTRPKIDSDKRYCVYCNDLSVEDEKHFMLSCKLYTEERKLFLSKLKEKLPSICLSNSEALFKIILSCYNGDAEVCNMIIKHIKQCMDKRGVSMT
jgi:hypothetical protein